ncbi:hypothetical protein AAG570_001385, partial [Ranatra chinensis]
NPPCVVCSSREYSSVVAGRHPGGRQQQPGCDTLGQPAPLLQPHPGDSGYHLAGHGRLPLPSRQATSLVAHQPEALPPRPVSCCCEDDTWYTSGGGPTGQGSHNHVPTDGSPQAKPHVDIQGKSLPPIELAKVFLT